MARSESQQHHHGSGRRETGAPLPYLDDMPETMRSMMNANARFQSEFLTLWSHRAQAWLNLPKQVFSCKSPADVSAAQGVFLSAMQRHYKEYFDCVVNDTLALELKDAGTNGKPPAGSARRHTGGPETVDRKAA